MSISPGRKAVAFLALHLFHASVFAAAGCTIGQVAELPVTMNEMRPMVTAKINGADARFLLDSGAFFSVLPQASAAQFGLTLRPAPFGLRLQGIGGSVETSVTTVREFTLADVPIRNVEFVVGGSHPGGDAVGVLGQNILRIADVEYDLANGAIRLMKPENCKKAVLAYWAGPEKPYSVIDISWATAGDPHTTGTVYLNGAKIKAMFDTGAYASMLSLSAAKRAGITPKSAGVVLAGYTRGVGSKLIESWVAPFESFKIGDEIVRNAKLRMGDLSMGDVDMLIGADFFLSHLVYVASSQQKLYFTYNGGPVFDLKAREPAPVTDESSSDEPAGAADASAAAAAGDKAAPIPVGEPLDAAAFARRGTAFAARRDFTRAIADLTRACELAPTVPDYFYERGRVRLRNREPALGLQDFNEALRLNPDFVPALMERADLRADQLGKEGGATEKEILADLDRVDALAPKQADLRLQLGLLYAHIDADRASIRQFDLWLESHASDVRVSGALGSRCWARGMLNEDLDKALTDCNRAVKVRPEVPFVLSRGLVYLRLGRLDPAIADFDAVLNTEPREAWALYLRGLARLRKGMKEAGESDVAASREIASRLPDEAAKRGLALP